MTDTKHTPGPWFNREGEIIADTREQTCCGNPVVGAEYMGQQEMVCCGCPEVDGYEEDVIARVTYERDIPAIIAAPDMLTALETVLAGGHLNTGEQAIVANAIAKATGRNVVDVVKEG